MLGIVGDFEEGPMLAMVEATFGGWAPAPGQPAAPPPLPREEFPPQDAVRGKVFLVDRPGLTQVGVGDGALIWARTTTHAWRRVCAVCDM